MTTADSSPAIPQTADDAYEGVGRQAWVLLWAAFISFMVLLIGIPLGINWYMNNATLPLPAQVEAIRGTTLVMESGSEDATAVIAVTEIREGEAIRTDETARANVSIYPLTGSTEGLATIQLRSNSNIVLNEARTPRFDASNSPDRIELRLDLGRARATASDVVDRPLEVIIKTPHSDIHLGDGSAAIAVTNDGTEVSARSGEVHVTAQDRTVVLNDGKRSTIALGQPPTMPVETSRNLITNGDFSEALDETWAMGSVVDAGDPSGVTYGEVSVVESGGRNAAYFVRDGEEGIHTETSINQDINIDVQDYDSLVLRLDGRLINQSLPGAGIQSSEFPLMVRIDFIDIDGNPKFWTWGFYADDPVANWPIRDGEKIPPFVWYDYESPDFLNSPTFPRPQRVVSISVYASGHNYRSQVSDIGLIAK